MIITKNRSQKLPFMDPATANSEPMIAYVIAHVMAVFAL